MADVLRVGMIGIGVGGAEILPAMEAMETVDLVAGADIVPATLQRFAQRFPNAKTYASAEELCRDSFLFPVHCTPLGVEPPDPQEARRPPEGHRSFGAVGR